MLQSAIKFNCPCSKYSMNDYSELNSSSSKMSYNTKLSALECSLQLSIANFKDIVKNFEELCVESEEYKRKFVIQKEKCESKSCCGSEALKKTIETKDNIIQQVASALSKLYETKNFNIINDAFKVICQEKTSHIKMELSDKCQIDKPTVKQEMNTPKVKLSDSFQDISFREESLSEIEGTPGRTSPIIQSKKQRNDITKKSSDFRDKKKCPENWPTPDNNKVVKLIFPTPSRSRANGKLRQTRFSVIKLKTNNVVDLTSSPELMSARTSQEGFKPSVQPLVKKESTDNDDTILPSPTSGSTKFPSLLKHSSKCSPFKKPPLSLKSKSEIKLNPDNNVENSPSLKPKTKIKCNPDNDNMENSPVINFKCIDANEESINLLRPIRSCNDMKENSPKKEHSIDYDEANCEIASSLSILQRVDMMEQNQEHNNKTPSPKKRPLEENKNISNVPDIDTDASMSLLRRETALGKPSEEKVKRNIPEPLEPVYKEPALRKKVEKRALPGWSCDECRIFYDELYKNDPEMLAKKMEECSKHRGKNNPIRPRTPDGFWNPRWDVPDDTEEFNKRNNAV